MREMKIYYIKEEKEAPWMNRLNDFHESLCEAIDSLLFPDDYVDIHGRPQSEGSQKLRGSSER